MDRLARDIDEITKNIRRKYRSLKHGIRESEELLTKTYKPILKPLEKLVKKEEVKVNEEEPPPQPSPQDYVATLFKGPLAREYFRLMLSGERLLDHTYGVRNADNKWMVGDSILEIDDDDSLRIGGKRYEGTTGLYELLFMKHPEDYTQNDLSAYKSILQDTNAHKRSYSPNTRLNVNKSKKYKDIIARLFPPRSGRGIDYVHWNDPNELVDRLRLLIESQQAGHTGHTNEIISIVEELREANIIL